MREVWLRGNVRILWFVAGVAGIVSAFGAVLAGYGWFAGQPGAVMVGLVAAIVPVAVYLWVRRHHTVWLVYQAGNLSVRLGAETEDIPLEMIECFLLGTAASFLPGERYRQTETRTLVVRLRENAPQWERREVDPRLGAWCGHHITIRGTWCEPLRLALIQRMNDRLAHLQRQRCAVS